MAIVTKAIKYCKTCFLFTGTVTMLLFIGAASLQDNLSKKYIELKEQNALTDYLDLAFDRIDEAPGLANKADSIVAKIWRHPISPDEKLAYYNLLTNIAYHLLQSGQVQTSTRWYEQAFRFYQQEKENKALTREMEFEEYVCKPLGNNYTRIGDFSKAIIIQQTAITSAIDNHKTEMLPALYANLATTYLNMQDYPYVQDISSKGIEAMHGNNSGAILLYNLKAQAYLKTLKLDSARYWNDKALSYNLVFADNKSWQISSLVDKAHILDEENKKEDALHYLLKAWDFEYLLSSREKAKVANEIGVSFFTLDNIVQGKSWFTKALNFFKLDASGLYPDYTVTGAMFGLAKCYERLQSSDSASYWYSQAVLNDYYTQQLIDTWLFTEGSIYSNDVNTEQAIAWHHSMYDTTGRSNYLLQALWLTELSKGRKLMYEQQRTKQWQVDTTTNANLFDELREDYLLLAQATESPAKEQIKKRIAEKEYDFSLKGNKFSRSLSAPSYKAFMAWLESARRKNTIVSYYTSDHSIFRISITKDTITHTADTASAFDDVYAFANTYFYAGPASFNNHPQAYFKTSNTLLKKYLPSVPTYDESYIISPAGALHQLSFEALCLKDDSAAYFGAHHAISYQYSLLQLTTPSAKARAAVNSFAFEKSHLGFPALPSSKEEIDFLSKNFKTKKHIAEQTADSLFYDALNERDIIHLSSHAVAGDSNTQPYIVLKDKLYLGQIQFNTAQCPLIVLAACETGKGITQQNEGMQSLGRVFLSKGVDGVLSSRWSVDDRATSSLIKTFYEELKKGEEPARALKNARVTYLKEHAAIAAQNPWLWAALYYQGVNQPIDIIPSTSYRLIFLIIAILIVAAILIFRRRKK